MGGNFFATLCSERPEYESQFAGSFHIATSMYVPSIQEYSSVFKDGLTILYGLTVSNE